jgi:hypothetical protein
LAKRSSPNKDKEDEDSDEGQDGNQELDPHSDTEADGDLNEKENCAAILEVASNSDSDSDSADELDLQPLSKLSYQSIIQQFEVLA